LKPETAHLNRRWAQLIIDELARNGVDYFCISPGSRSTPLAMAVAEHEKVSALVHFDERGSAFHALGYARATGRPAAVITTSGTAVANLFPAVVEASNDLVPMILLTADRPPELIDTGANQTINQREIFGRYARWFHDMPCPMVDVSDDAVLATIDQAIMMTLNQPAGPVHINCRYRKPLIPAPEQCTPLDSSAVAEGGDRTGPLPTPTRRMIDPLTIARLNRHLSAVTRGVVVVGRLASSDETAAVREMVQVLGWPVVADLTSGLRLGSDTETIIPHYDLILAADPMLLEDEPVTILHLGGRLVSERLRRFLAGASIERYVQVDPSPRRNDPDHCVTQRLTGDLVSFCNELTPLLRPIRKGDWQTAVIRASHEAVSVIEKATRSPQNLGEPAVARLISQHIAPDSGLFVGSSMPVRDMNTFADHSGAAVVIGCNRGASGIDGTIASAAGFCHGLRQPTSVLLGDLAMLHDLNSLTLANKLDQPLTIVVLNNDGGGIFGFLPIREHLAVFEDYFVAPHGLNMQAAAELFGLDYHCPTDSADFVSVFTEAQAGSRSTIIEVMTDRDSNVKWHQSIIDELTTRLGGGQK